VGIQTLSAQVIALKTDIGQKLKLKLNLNLNDPVLEQFSTDFSELRKEVLTLKAAPPSFNLSNNAARIEKCPCLVLCCLVLSY
jgi:hypothetical protein